MNFAVWMKSSLLDGCCFQHNCSALHFSRTLSDVWRNCIIYSKACEVVVWHTFNLTQPLENIWPLSASIPYVSALLEHSVMLGQILWPCHGPHCCGAASSEGTGFGWVGILWITVQSEQFPWIKIAVQRLFWWSTIYCAGDKHWRSISQEFRFWASDQLYY